MVNFLNNLVGRAIVSAVRGAIGNVLSGREEKKEEVKKETIVKEVSPMNDTLLIALRQILLIAGGGLVTNGVIGKGELETLIGAVLIIIAAIWRYVDAYLKRKNVAALKVVQAAQVQPVQQPKPI